LVGSGYRARTMLRVMAALPQWFDVVGVAARNADDRRELAAMGFPAYTTVEHLISHGSPDFVVSTLHAGDAQPIIKRLVELSVPVLTETPAAGSIEELVALWKLVQEGAKIQVAEQYHLEPLIAAQIAVAQSEMLGGVTDVLVSVAHDYHGISVMRRLLNVHFEEPLVAARTNQRQVYPSPSRYHDPEGTELVDTNHTLAWFDYDLESGVADGPKLGFYDFDDVQYRSWVRTPTVVLRGPLGELREDKLHIVNIDDDGAAPTPVTAHIERVAAGGAGSHEGMFLRGYQVFGESAYSNPFLPARLADDEIAIAEILARMGTYVLKDGPEPYPVAEGAQDQYLALVMKEAARTGEAVRAVRQPWAF
jgi:hypothetical protein